MLQSRYILCVLFEYTATLSLADVQYIDPEGARDDFRHMWGVDRLERLSRYDGLLAVRLSPLGAYATGCADDCRSGPAPAAGAQSLVRVLPNFGVVALDGLASAGALLLDAFAIRSADSVWTLFTASLLKTLHTDRDLKELRRFLVESSAGDELPQTVTALPADAASPTKKVRDLGTCHLLECVDEAQAMMIAKDRRAGALCSRIGQEHLTVPLGGLPAFRTALLKLGYVLPARL
ncbi:hypothetical protein [Streptomyces sp. JNUCC 63]